MYLWYNINYETNTLCLLLFSILCNRIRTCGVCAATAVTVDYLVVEAM